MDCIEDNSDALNIHQYTPHGPANSSNWCLQRLCKILPVSSRSIAIHIAFALFRLPTVCVSILLSGQVMDCHLRRTADSTHRVPEALIGHKVVTLWIIVTQEFAFQLVVRKLFIAFQFMSGLQKCAAGLANSAASGRAAIKLVFPAPKANNQTPITNSQ